MALNFAIIGVGGFVAPRHLAAIHHTGNRIVAATDPHDSVGVLDRFGMGIQFFKETERFDRFLDKMRRRGEAERIQWVAICSPNYLHDAHIRIALRNEANAICEKPLVISPWNLDALEQLERETGHRVFTVLQLRSHPTVLELREATRFSDTKASVELTYITSRGPWYRTSWKGSEERSGGIAMNIGIHLFDMLIWVFGPPVHAEVHHTEPTKMAGFLELEHANVKWFLSVDPQDLPKGHTKTTYRSITVSDRDIDFTDGFSDLHIRVYEATLAGDGIGIAGARQSIELVHRLRTERLVANPDCPHPYCRQLGHEVPR